jgi:hypothetical protein
MSDQCQYCIYAGDINKCLKSECFQHENWFVAALIDKLSQTEVECVVAGICEDQQFCFEMGFNEGAAAVRKTISKFKVWK